MIERTIGGKERFYYILYGSLPKNLFSESFYILFAPIMIVWLLGLTSLLFPHLLHKTLKTSLKSMIGDEFATDKEILTNRSDDDNKLLKIIVTTIANVVVFIVGCAAHKSLISDVGEIDEFTFLVITKIFGIGVLSTIGIMTVVKVIMTNKISIKNTTITYKIKDND